MTHQGALLQHCNNELVKLIENVYIQREELDKQIGQAEDAKNKIEGEIELLTKQLESVGESLAQKTAMQKKLDKILAETEVAYEKILESSRLLLNVLKTETGNLDKMDIQISNTSGSTQLREHQQIQHQSW